MTTALFCVNRNLSFPRRLTMQQAAGAAGLATAGLLSVTPSVVLAEGENGVHTLLTNDHFTIQEEGDVVLAVEGGATIRLSPDQYLVLEDGVLIVIDEVAQNAIATLPVIGAFRARLEADVSPVSSPSGDIVRITSAEPLWSGEGEPGRLSSNFSFDRYELAQAQAGEGTTAGTSVVAGVAAGGLALSAGVAILLNLLSGSEAEAAAEVPTTGTPGPSGVLTKGPLSNAFVFIDYNGDGDFEGDEPSATTNENGEFSFPEGTAPGPLIAWTFEATIDEASGTTMGDMTFRAPAGSTVVTPLTTLMEDTGLSADEVKSVLGLPDDVDPLTFNPFGADVDPQDALVMEKVALQVTNAIASMAGAAQGAGAPPAEAFAAAVSAVGDVMHSKRSSGEALDLADTTDLNAIQSNFITAANVLTGTDTGVLGRVIDNTKTAIQNVNAKIGEISDTNLRTEDAANTFGLLHVLRHEIILASETDDPGSISLVDPNAVDTAAQNSPPTNIQLSSTSIAEDADSLIVGRLTAEDKESALADMGFSLGWDTGLNFEIEGNEFLKFKEQPNFEEQSSYDILVVVQDEDGKRVSERFIIEVEDVNQYIGRDEFLTAGAFTGTSKDEWIGYRPDGTREPNVYPLSGSDGQFEGVTFDMTAGGDNHLYSGAYAGAMNYQGGPNADHLTIKDLATKSTSPIVNLNMALGGDNRLDANAKYAQLDYTGGPDSDRVDLGRDAGGDGGNITLDMTLGGTNIMVLGKNAAANGGTITYSGGTGSDRMLLGDKAAGNAVNQLGLPAILDIDLGDDGAFDQVVFEGAFGVENYDGDGQAIGNKVTISNANPGDAIEFLAFKLSEVTVESLGSGQSLIKAGQNGSELVINENASNIYLTAATDEHAVAEVVFPLIVSSVTDPSSYSVVGTEQNDWFGYTSADTSAISVIDDLGKSGSASIGLKGGTNHFYVGDNAASSGGSLDFTGGSGADHLSFGENLAFNGGSASLNLRPDTVSGGVTDTIQFRGTLGNEFRDSRSSGTIKIANFDYADDTIELAENFIVEAGAPAFIHLDGGGSIELETNVWFSETVLEAAISNVSPKNVWTDAEVRNSAQTAIYGTDGDDFVGYMQAGTKGTDSPLSSLASSGGSAVIDLGDGNNYFQAGSNAAYKFGDLDYVGGTGSDTLSFGSQLAKGGDAYFDMNAGGTNTLTAGTFAGRDGEITYMGGTGSDSLTFGTGVAHGGDVKIYLRSDSAADSVSLTGTVAENSGSMTIYDFDVADGDSINLPTTYDLTDDGSHTTITMHSGYGSFKLYGVTGLTALGI